MTSPPPAPRVVCAPNAFKGTLSAAGAAAAMARGVRAAWPDATVVEVPMADGGDGTLDVLLSAAGPSGRVDRVVVSGPLGTAVVARLGWTGAHDAVVELAEASGLRLLGRVPTSLDALAASSRGTGELLRHALDAGARRIVVGVGGSACTDGGAGLLEALGVRLLDAAGDPLRGGGAALAGLVAVDASGLDPRVAATAVRVAADTSAPLLGPTGAAAVFGPQKGASAADVALLESGLRRLAGLAGPALGAPPELAASPRTGAAGGCAWALAALGAQVVSGAALVADAVHLDGILRGATLAVTGEGRLDAQTATGKAPAEVLSRARAAGVPCIAVAGSVVPEQSGAWTDVEDAGDAAARLGIDSLGEAAAAVEAATTAVVRRRQPTTG